MRLVVDANILIAEAMRARGRELLMHPNLDLVVADLAWNETTHELRKRTALIVKYGHLEQQQATQLLTDALDMVALRVHSVPAQGYSDRLEEALWRIPRDARDIPTVALALVLDCGIWTADYDFFGCGLPIWGTETIQHYLVSSSAQRAYPND